MMIYNSTVKCPFCGYANNVKIPENQWLMRIICQACKKTIFGKENPHDWNWVLCAYGDVPWVQIQAKEQKLW